MFSQLNHRRVLSLTLSAAVLHLALAAGCSSSPSKPRAATQPANNATAMTATSANNTRPATGAAPIEVQLSPTRLAELREAAVQRIEDLSRSTDPQIRANAVEAAASASIRLKPIIAAGLIDNNAGVRAVALMTIGRLQITDLVGKTSSLNTDPSPFVRAAAIYAQTRCGRKVDPSPLADMLLTGTSINLRGHAAFLIGELGDRSAIPLLKEAARQSMPLASPSERNKLQLQIAEAMVKLGETGYIEGIRAALFPATPEELESMALAVQVIGELRDRGSISQLINMSEYRNQTNQYYPAEVRLGIASSLAKMGKDQGGFIADEYQQSTIVVIRSQAAITYGFTGRSEHAEKLALLMQDPEALVQVHAAAGLLKVYATSMGENR
jgi:HEAT repeat protein